MNIEKTLLNLHVRFLELQADESNYAMRQQSIILNRIEKNIKKNNVTGQEVIEIIGKAEIILENKKIDTL